MADIEELRKRRMQQLMASQGQQQLSQQASQQAQAEMQMAELEAQVKTIMQQILSPAARERLGNIRAARPDYARQVELLLIQTHQMGRLPTPVTDEALKQILTQIKGKQRKTTITHR